MKIEISTNAADLIRELAIDEMRSIERGTTSYGDAEANVAGIEALTEVVDQIDAAYPWNLTVNT